jgi:hypothetical protein
MLGVVAVSFAFLRAIDATQTDTFGVLVVQDFDGVAVGNGDDGAGEVSNGSGGVAPFWRVAKELTGVKVISIYSNSVSFLLITLLGNCVS